MLLITTKHNMLMSVVNSVLFNLSYVFGYCFRSLAVIFVSDLKKKKKKKKKTCVRKATF